MTAPPSASPGRGMIHDSRPPGGYRRRSAPRTLGPPRWVIPAAVIFHSADGQLVTGP